MKNPQEESAEPEMREPEWKDTPSGVVHLGDNDFDDFVKSHPSMLVMFYAPCKFRVAVHQGGINL